MDRLHGSGVTRIPSGPASKVCTYQRSGTCAMFVSYTAIYQIVSSPKRNIDPSIERLYTFIGDAQGQITLTAVDIVVYVARHVCRRSAVANPTLSHLPGQLRNTSFSTKVALACPCYGRGGCNRYIPHIHVSIIARTHQQQHGQTLFSLTSRLQPRAPLLCIRRVPPPCFRPSCGRVCDTLISLSQVSSKYFKHRTHGGSTLPYMFCPTPLTG